MSYLVAMGDRREAGVPPLVYVTGRRNSGKTTLLVAVGAELLRRGVRVATIKHSHHDAEIDHAGTDSWRHFHDGGAGAVVLCAAGRLMLVERTNGALADPTAVAARYFGGGRFDLVLVEGFKSGAPPKLEVFRSAVDRTPLVDEASARPEQWIGVVTDAPDRVAADVPCIELDPDGAHIAAVCELVLRAAGLWPASAEPQPSNPAEEDAMKTSTHAEPPAQFEQLTNRFPELARAYSAYGEAATTAGPLASRDVHLVKLGISIGMRHEGAVHAHTRKALAAGFTPDEVRHAALVAAPTLGWPAMMAAYLWVEDEIEAAGGSRIVTADGMR